MVFDARGFSTDVSNEAWFREISDRLMKLRTVKVAFLKRRRAWFVCVGVCGLQELIGNGRGFGQPREHQAGVCFFLPFLRGKGPPSKMNKIFHSYDPYVDSNLGKSAGSGSTCAVPVINLSQVDSLATYLCQYVHK